MDYKLLGSRNRQRHRRYRVYELMLYGFQPKDISKSLRVPLRTVYRDVRFIENLPVESSPDLMETKQRARDYWRCRLRYYSVMEHREKNPYVRIAVSKAKDEVARELFKLSLFDVEERLVRLEEAVLGVKH